MGKPKQRDLDAVTAPYEAADYAGAARAARKFTRRWPDHETGWATLGKSLYRLGQLDEAESALAAALRLAPAQARLYNDLGLVLLAAGRPGDAEARLSAGLEYAPDDPGLLANLASALALQRRPRDAERVLRRALVARPDDARLIEALGGALRDQLRFAEAAKQFRRAASLQPGWVRPQLERGRVLRELGEHDEAERAFRRAAERAPDDAGVQASVGVVLSDRGRRDEALAAYRRAAELDPRLVGAYTGILANRPPEPDDPDVAALAALVDDPGIDARERARGHYALGAARARLDADVEAAWHHYAAGAALRRAAIDYDPAAREQHIDDLRAAFTDAPPAPSEDKAPTTRPVFVVGMPRSGTTLVEQILAAHPEVETAGERADAQRLVEATAAERGTTYPAGFDTLGTEALERIAAEYRRAVVEPRAGARWVIDKQPDNHRHVGLLARALPEAVFLHVTREPADTCVSCFTHDFVAPWTDYTFDLAELGHYYRLYAALMAHWRAVLPPGRLVELRYESVVDDLEANIAPLLHTLGLDWDPACADFHRADTAVATASKFQVRQPLYRGAIGRWRRYANHLGPLFETLGPLAPSDRAEAPEDTPPTPG